MKAIDQLRTHYFLASTGIEDALHCINWAIERLLADEEANDNDIVLLAAAKTEDNVLPVVEIILKKYITDQPIDDLAIAGKYIVDLRCRYLSGEETISTLNSKINKIYYKKDYPDWLAMLSRNCEYATDIPAFIKPFEEEFSYIADLWEMSSSLKEFLTAYDRSVSNGR
jgi:hypothetical protein